MVGDPSIHPPMAAPVCPWIKTGKKNAVFRRFFIVFFLPRALIVNASEPISPGGRLKRRLVNGPPTLLVGVLYWCIGSPWSPSRPLRNNPPQKRDLSTSPSPGRYLSFLIFLERDKVHHRRHRGIARHFCVVVRKSTDGMIKTMRSSWRVEGAVGQQTSTTTTTTV